jgi:hypothetical protein
VSAGLWSHLKLDWGRAYNRYRQHLVPGGFALRSSEFCWLLARATFLSYYSLAISYAVFGVCIPWCFFLQVVGESWSCSQLETLHLGSLTEGAVRDAGMAHSLCEP